MENNKNKNIQAIISMIERSENAKSKFMPNTPQHTLQKNRIKALYIILALLEKEINNHDKKIDFTKEEFENAFVPITSLINKSEKAQKKLKIGTWQYIMLENNLSALYIALPLLNNAINDYKK